MPAAWSIPGPNPDRNPEIRTGLDSPCTPPPSYPTPQHGRRAAHRRVLSGGRASRPSCSPARQRAAKPIPTPAWTSPYCCPEPHRMCHDLERLGAGLCLRAVCELRRTGMYSQVDLEFPTAASTRMAPAGPAARTSSSWASATCAAIRSRCGRAAYTRRAPPDLAALLPG
jgi:hypothetical protein